MEDVRHFVLECEEFEQDRCEFLTRIKRIEGAERWVAEYKEGGVETRVSLLLGKGVDVGREVMEEVDKCIMNGEVVAEA